MRKLLRASGYAFAGLALCLLALCVHYIAVAHALEGQPTRSGPATLVLTFVLVIFLMVLACRYLLLLGLASFDRWVHQPPPRPRGAAMPFVSVIVPAFNEAPMIRSVLDALLAVDYPGFEVLVIDDGSSDQTFLRALPYQQRRADVEIRVLAKANGGKFDALNYGISRARGEIVVCIDGDSLLQPDALRHCVPHFDDPAIGAVAGNVRVVNRGTVWSALQALEYVIGLGLIKRAQSAARAVTIVPGPLGAFRKTALAEVKGYDGDTFAEDFDLTVKLLSVGWHIVYEPRALVLTEAPERTLDLLRQRYRWTRGSLQVLRKRSHGLWTPRAAPLRFFGLWVLGFEGLGLPALHVLAQTVFVAGGLALGLHHLVLYWWLQLLILDCAVAVFCVAIEEESPGLLILGPLFRLFYMLVLDVARLFAAIDEFARVGMSWDKLARLGRLTPSKP